MFFFLVFFFVLFPLLAESGSAGGENNGTEYVIRNVNYTIDGKTRKDVLSHYLDIKEGRVFASEAALEVFIKDRLQMIKNQRTLAEGTIKTKYIRDDQNPERIFVDLEVYVTDTWNYLLLPYAKYDSNDGFLLSLRGRNYNFLGSMNELSWNLDYLLDTSGNAEYSINGGFSLPFYLWDFSWMFNFDEDVTVSPDDPLEIYTKGGLSVDIPLNSIVWQASVNQYYYLNEDGSDDADGYYFKTDARFGSSFSTGVRLPLLGLLSYSPGVISSYSYKPFGSLSEERKGYELGLEHSFTAGRINWIGNFRDGALFTADQNLRYNFTRDIWLSDSNFEIQYHKAFGWGGISSRLMGEYFYNGTSDDTEDIGGPIRGILNDRLNGNAALFFNFDFPVKVWNWFFSRWFENHLSVFFDYALVKPEGGSFSLDDGWYGSGVEGFIFLKAARSIYIRVSVGLDMQAIMEGALPGDPAPRDGASIYEIFIGLGHQY